MARPSKAPPDYGRVFGKETALGLGLGQSPRLDPAKAVEDYRRDPADAFSRMADLMFPGGAIPIPFMNTIEPSHAREPRPA